MRKFQGQYWSIEKIESLGWQQVRNVDGADIQTWVDLGIRANSKYPNICTENGWPRFPLEIKNERFFNICPNFCRHLRSSSEWSDVINDYQSQNKITKYCNISPSYFASSGCTFSIGGVIDFSLPAGLLLTKTDGMVQEGEWFTQPHIEIGGDDSISKVPFGDKLFVICERGAASANFDRLITTPQDFIQFLLKGPQNTTDKNTVRFYFPKSSSFLCQPALCCHAVLTRSGRSFVCGWEATILDDRSRCSDVLRFYCYGSRRDFIRSMVSREGIEKTIEYLRLKIASDTDILNDALEHLLSFKNSGVVVHSEKKSIAGRPRVSKKKKLALRLPCVKAKKGKES